MPLNLGSTMSFVMERKEMVSGEPPKPKFPNLHDIPPDLRRYLPKYRALRDRNYELISRWIDDWEDYIEEFAEWVQAGRPDRERTVRTVIPHAQVEFQPQGGGPFSVTALTAPDIRGVYGYDLDINNREEQV